MYITSDVEYSEKGEVQMLWNANENFVMPD